jgi:hypothetical protein
MVLAGIPSDHGRRGRSGLRGCSGWLGFTNLPCTHIRPASLIFPKDLIFVNKFILPFVPRRDTATEDSPRAQVEVLWGSRDHDR